MTFEEILAKQGKLVYTNTGVSMMPLLRQHRDLLIIAPKPEGRLHMWDVPLYRRDNGQYIMHRVLWVRKNDYIMCGDNQWYLERGIQDRHIIGVLEAVSRDGKILPVRATKEHPNVPWKYKLYVFVWCFFYPIRAVLIYFRNKWIHFKIRVKNKLRQK
jgi:hypothetical protein